MFPEVVQKIFFHTGLFLYIVKKKGTSETKSTKKYLNGKSTCIGALILLSLRGNPEVPFLTMREPEQLISSIETRLKQLISLRRKDQEEINRLTHQIIDLKTTIQTLETALKQSEEKVNLLKITKSLEKGKENIDAKRRINEMIKEIDKCIGMLNS